MSSFIFPITATGFASGRENRVKVNINVSANDGHVTLSGSVETWSERDMAKDVAWRSPG